ncbi:MAG: prepilin peptidase [Lachnospiraceae bacterium]|nr:prepilin peptidase [Lachnospiraceae bacterium]MCM1240851.1 prepilin peptidase [Lachnospiraceae bacterium]
MLQLLIRVTICMAFYVVGAYATTDILRLLKGHPVPIGDSSCFCESCGCKLTLRQQIPIFSYLLSHGKCRNCSHPISPGNFILEALFTSVFTLAAVMTGFRPAVWLFCVGFYESVKLFCVLLVGKRGRELAKGLLLSFLGNAVNFSLVGILFFFHTLVP